MNKEYSADDIQTLSIGEAIRMRPQLYFDKCFNENSLDSLPFEVLCHAFDEYFDGTCKKITITIFTDYFIVHYDAGILLELNENNCSKAEIIMTQIFACKNEKKHIAVGEEFCSVGMATINFAAEQCELTTVCNGKKGIYVFENGITVSREIVTTFIEEAFTTILVKPNKQLFGVMGFTFDGIQEKATHIHTRLPSLTISVENCIQA